MDKDLRELLEKRGLSPTASDREAKEFFDAMSLEQKGIIGTEMAKRGFEKSGRPDDDFTVRASVETKPDITVGHTTDHMNHDITMRGFCLRAESVDEETRSVEAVIATDEPVAIYDYRSGEIIDEILHMDGADIPDQVPMLANHSRWSLDDVFGSCRSMIVGGHNVIGRLHFATDDDSERAWGKVKDGHLRDVSAGYRVDKYTDIKPGQSAAVGGKTYTAEGRTLRVSTQWSLREVSLVPIGADVQSKIRADQPLGANPMKKELREYLEKIGLRKDADEEEAYRFLAELKGDQKSRAEAIERGEDPANHPADPPADPVRSDPPADPPADPAAIARQAVADERNRVHQLRKLASDDVAEDVLRQAIDDGWDIERATAAFLTSVRQRGPSGPAIHSRSHEADCNPRSLAAGFISTSGLDPTTCRMHNGRSNPNSRDMITEQDAERGDQYRNMSGYDLIRECILIDTGRHVRTKEDALEQLRAMRATPSGGTLSYVFTTSVYAKLLEGWNAVGDTTTGWCDEEDVENFLTQEDISIAANAHLEKLPSGETARHADISDTEETYSIARYAKQFVADEQDILNDRLGALMRMPMELGQAARETRPNLVYATILANGTMTDTGAVFNATAVTTTGGHANLLTSSLSAEGLQAGISAMVKQRLNRTSTNPGRQLNIRPRFLLVPAALEWTARGLCQSETLVKLFADSNSAYASQLNLIARDGLTPIVDDRIGTIGVWNPATGAAVTGSDTGWYLAEGRMRGLRVAYRRGTDRLPQVRSFVLDRGQWGLGWDVNFDIGAAFTEWRTWFSSAGDDS